MTAVEVCLQSYLEGKWNLCAVLLAWHKPCFLNVCQA